MRVWKFFFCLFACASASLCADLEIQNVTVVDVVSGTERARQSILIHDGQITAVGSHVHAPRNARTISGAGKYAIPGLWDMHVHLWHRDNQFPLFLANGVTGVRDMGSDLSWVNHWRDQIKAGTLLGPHIQTSGPAVDGSASQDEKLPVFVVNGPNDARATFDRLDSLDIDFIEVLSGVSREAYFALIERARKYYVPVAGHVPAAVSLMEAIDARQKSVEHMTGILMACSKREDKLRSRLLLATEKKDWNAYREIRAEALDTFDLQKSAELFERMARFETREVPTLVMLRRSIYADADQLAASPHLAIIPASIRKGWTDPREDRKKISEATLELANAEYEKLRELLPIMKRAGVKIMAGTDTGDPYTFPGYDLHRELELLVTSGLSPLDALRSATLEPARYFDATDTTGSIEAGRDADLVLLDADPLQDIRNTQKIAAVILGGKYLTKAQLNSRCRVSPAPLHSKRNLNN